MNVGLQEDSVVRSAYGLRWPGAVRRAMRVCGLVTAVLAGGCAAAPKTQVAAPMPVSAEAESDRQTLRRMVNRHGMLHGGPVLYAMHGIDRLEAPKLNQYVRFLESTNVVRAHAIRAFPVVRKARALRDAGRASAEVKDLLGKLDALPRRDNLFGNCRSAMFNGLAGRPDEDLGGVEQACTMVRGPDQWGPWVERLATAVESEPLRLDTGDGKFLPSQKALLAHMNSGPDGILGYTQKELAEVYNEVSLALRRADWRHSVTRKLQPQDDLPQQRLAWGGLGRCRPGYGNYDAHGCAVAAALASLYMMLVDACQQGAFGVDELGARLCRVMEREDRSRILAEAGLDELVTEADSGRGSGPLAVQ